jgi:hypothetical protein
VCLKTAVDGEFFVNLLQLPLEERRLSDVKLRFTRLDTRNLVLKRQKELYNVSRLNFESMDKDT